MTERIYLSKEERKRLEKKDVEVRHKNAVRICEIDSGGDMWVRKGAGRRRRRMGKKGEEVGCGETLACGWNGEMIVK